MNEEVWSWIKISPTRNFILFNSTQRPESSGRQNQEHSPFHSISFSYYVICVYSDAIVTSPVRIQTRNF